MRINLKTPFSNLPGAVWTQAKSVSNTDTRCSVDGQKRYGNDKCGRKSF